MYSATAIFTVAVSVALTGLFVRDTSGDVGLPPLIGGVETLAPLAGLVAVTLLWRRSRSSRP